VTPRGRRRRAVLALARKDLGVALRTPAVTLPLAIVPALVYLALPLGLIVMVRLTGDALVATELAEMERFLAALPAGLQADLADLAPAARMLVLLLGYLLAPLFLVVPLMVASVLAADAFAGEKERGTLEALLHAPVPERSLFAGKLLAAWIPAVVVGAVGIAAYAAVATVAAWPVVGRPFLPATVWTSLALWVGPAVALAALAATVLISARVRTFQEAYQLGGVVVVPVVALVVAQAAGVLVIDGRLLLAVGAAVWALDALLLAIGLRGFTRDTLARHL
jgi:ABC-type transport system involved in multi-copper enzyme maturation permease subunit